MRKRDFWVILCFVSICYILVSVGIYKRLDKQISRTLNLEEEQPVCPKVYSPRHAHFSGFTVMVSKMSQEWSTCNAKVTAEHHGVDIQMEKEWSSIKVTYPKLILTVTGWVPDLQVPSYKVKGHDRPLHVIFVPHSHQDPGWLSTFESYYSMFTRDTLNNIVDQLTANPTWRFIWSEIIFLSKWWDAAAGDTRDKFLKLVREGRLEIVTGAWVMSDEASVHYEAMLDQLIEGQQWLYHNIGVEARSGWSIDQFGYSPTMPYLMKESGINNLVIQRVHYSVKKHLSASRSLEFFWHQTWEASTEEGLFCHLMPFLSYSIAYSCGPQPHVCCKFDFSHKKCMFGKKPISPTEVTDENVEKLSWELWDQLQRKSHLYKSNVLLVPHGDDFRYSDSVHWGKQLGNLQKIFTFMNSREQFGVKMEFGTLSDYFSALEKDKSHFPDERFPSLSGDFFPYTDRSDQYWTGYYTSRPLYKHMTRVLQAKIRLLDIWYILCLARAIHVKNMRVYEYLRDVFPEISGIRRANGHFQHHDAITGTSSASVVRDYAKILHNAMNQVDDLIGIVTTILSTDGIKHGEAIKSHITWRDDWKSLDKPPGQNTFEVNEKRVVLINNPLTMRRREVMKVVVTSPDVVVTDAHDKEIFYQINPVLTPDFKIYNNSFEVAFEVDVPPLSIKKYYLKPHKDGRKYLARVSAINVDINGSGHFKVYSGQELRVIEMDNGYYRVSISTCSGFMQHLHRKVDDLMHEVKVKFMTYDTGSMFKDKSGAYTFQPNGPATELDIQYPEMILVQGGLMSTVHTSFRRLVHSVTLHRIEGGAVSGVHIENHVHMNSREWDNKELVMRIDSTVYNRDHSVCVDLNGFQMHRKLYRSKLTMQGNFHPLTTMAYIEDTFGTRLSVLAAESHGIANLLPGWLEVVLDRRLMQGDWRGMNEGVKNNMPTTSHFILMLERGPQKVDPGPFTPACFPSPSSHQMSRRLNHPLALGVVDLQDSSSITYLPQLSLISKGFPPGLELVNLRSLRVNNTSEVTCLMILHHAGLDCDFQETLEEQGHFDKEKQSLDVFKDAKILKAYETSLNGLKAKQKLNVFQSAVPPMELKTYKISFG